MQSFDGPLKITFVGDMVTIKNKTKAFTVLVLHITLSKVTSPFCDEMTIAPSRIVSHYVMKGL